MINRLPPKLYRGSASPLKKDRYILVLPPPPKSLLQQNDKTTNGQELLTTVLHDRAEKYRHVLLPLPPNVVIVSKRIKNDFFQTSTVIWQCRPACVRLKTGYRGLPRK